MSDITVVIPTIPNRRDMLHNAIESVLNQTLFPEEIIVTVDISGRGASFNRNQGLFKSSTTWTAFLDDDDIMYPDHLESLLKRAESTNADLVYPWFDGQNSEGILAMGGEHPEGLDPKPELLDNGNWIPITYLVNTKLAQGIGGFPELESDRWPHDNCEDWGFLRDLRDAGGKIAHLNKRTWKWVIHGKHTSGRSWKKYAV